MPAMISEERAREFAAALVASGGNRTAAGKLCNFPPGNAGSHLAMRMVRHPLVQKHLQTEVQQKLQSVTPKAVAALEGLLTSKSAYIRLDAAKDVLTRNGIGTQRDGASTTPMLINIQIGERSIVPETSESVATTIIEHADLMRTLEFD
jgi:hypothetical protein